MAIDYEISLRELDGINYPENIEIDVQNDDGTVTNLRTTNLTGSRTLSEISEAPIKNVVIRWIWNIDLSVDESEYQGEEFGFDLELRAAQKY